jgi:hypothetical protein
MKRYLVDYSGWLMIEANNEDEAFQLASEQLSQSGITNDGDEGEWEITDTIEEEDEE